MKIKIKTLFISDVHLGNPNSQPKKLLRVFEEYEFENLFILGDFIDLTYMKRNSSKWNNNHFKVIQKIIKYSKQGINITYLIGNHDIFIKDVLNNGELDLGNIKICEVVKYNTTKGRKILLVHGDCFDGFIKIHPFLYRLGDSSYELSIKLNKVLNWFREKLGLPYWSLSGYLKTKVKNVTMFLNQYEKLAKDLIKNNDCESLMMGHTHCPTIEENYYNTGDFCESCSYMIERLDGDINLLYVR